LNGPPRLKEIRDQLAGVAAGEGRSIDDCRFALLRCAYAGDSRAEIESYLDSARYSRRISEALRFRRAQSDDGFLVREEPG
ncbi:LLM class flavin-dependent oxidoreductase, partial [Acinetobacter baumannii]